ncbi:hypothetical protein CHS0354_019633 [Potamilus streckersoni]|nr:hypothetical protein CHS0354_019633 [Potamilus streckersoni]
MALFKAFRNEFGYAHYDEQRIPVMMDVPLILVIYYCVLVSIAVLVYAGGIRGKERWHTLIRLVYILLMGSVFLVSIFGHNWQTAYTDNRSPYIYRSDSYVDGKITIKIGLYTVNISLSGHFKDENNNVDYNEEVFLEDIGGTLSELHNALDGGIPEPILMVLEHFDIDEGGLRFGRSCKLAGYFAGILLWTGFAFWIAANVILCSVVWHGAVCCTVSGVCVILAIVVYHHLNPSHGFRLPGSQGDVQLRYGWCLWFNLILGTLTTLFGITMILADYKYPKKVAAFFILETALEDDLEDYPHRCSAPLMHDNKNYCRGHSTMFNRNRTYGSDSNQYQKENPIIEDSNSNDSTINGQDCLFTSAQALSKLKSDKICSFKSIKDVAKRHVIFNEALANSASSRLNEICVDTEGNINNTNAII